jgi:hypothetical protein
LESHSQINPTYNKKKDENLSVEFKRIWTLDALEIAYSKLQIIISAMGILECVY